MSTIESSDPDCNIIWNISVVNGEKVIRFQNDGEYPAQITIIEGDVADDASAGIVGGVFSVATDSTFDIPYTYPLCFTYNCSEVKELAVPIMGDCPDEVEVGEEFTFTASGCDEYWWRVQSNEVSGENNSTYVRSWTKGLEDREVCVACKVDGQVFADLVESDFVCCPVFDVIAPTVELSTREASLLDSSCRMGFGENTTGGAGGTLCTVTNTNDSGAGSLRECLQTPNSWVIYDPSLDGQTIYLNSQITLATNVTWDGRDALVQIAEGTLPNSGYMNLIVLANDNAIIHRVLLQGTQDYENNNPNGTSIAGFRVLQGENYWLDHVEARWLSDDPLSVGLTSSSNSAINVTITNYKVDNIFRGLLIANDQSPAQDADRTGRVTIACCDMSATCRNFRNSGADWVHGFNNYSHDWGGDSCGTISGHGVSSNRDGTDTPITLVESSVFDDPNDGLVGQTAVVATTPQMTIQGYVFTDGANQYLGGGGTNQYVIEPGDPVPAGLVKPVPPYDYSGCFIPTDEVVAKVTANAGVNGADIIFPPYA